MDLDIQRASMWKRISAWLFDSILMISVVVLVAYVLSGIFHYDQHNARLNAAYEKYQAQFDVEFGRPEAAEDATDEEKEAYKQRYAEAEVALKADPEAIDAYGEVSNLVLLIPTISLFVAMLLMEFIIPMLLKNGQTLGKKIFSLGVVRVDAVKMSGVQTFVRAILCKYTVGLMIPLYMLIFFLLGIMGGIAVLLAFGLMLVQLLCPLFNRDHRGLHDLLSGTVTVDLPSQKVFKDAQERLDYMKKVHAENAARQDY